MIFESPPMRGGDHFLLRGHDVCYYTASHSLACCYSRMEVIGVLAMHLGLGLNSRAVSYSGQVATV